MRHLLQFLSKKASAASSVSSPLRFSRQRLHSLLQPPSFGIAFDIDGVILLGHNPIGGSPQALQRLYHDSGSLKIPYVFLTNGGGVPESKRARELTKQLGVNISPLQVIQGHTPFKELVKRFENELVVAVGKGEPAEVITEYGFKNVISMDDYASYFENIDPLAQYKNWKKVQAVNRERSLRTDPVSQRVQAVFIVSDPIDWSRDIQITLKDVMGIENTTNGEFWKSWYTSIWDAWDLTYGQVLCDILRTGGLPGREIAHQPPIFLANDDLAYQALFPAERLGMGAFRIALESIFNSIHPNAMEYTSYGKPNPLVFKNAENVLKQVLPYSYYNNPTSGGVKQPFKTLYMVGDNPSVDVKGAQQAGHPWYSILTRTGVFKGTENHADYPADLVVDTVEEAVDYILTEEFSS